MRQADQRATELDWSEPEETRVSVKTLPASQADNQGRSSAGDHPRVYLLVFQGDSSRMVPVRPDGDVVLGRDASADVQLLDGSVSRRHACLSLVDGLASIRDLHSQNGTKINGESITGSRPLVSGDVITIGSVTLSFQTSSRRPVPRELLSQTVLQEHASMEIERSSRFQRPLAMLAIDLGLGGQVDRIAIARLLEPRLRVIDSIAWSGSDQLLVVQPETDASGARTAAEAALAILHGVAPFARAGIASWPEDGSDVDTLIGSARSAALAADPGGVADADRSSSTRTVGRRVLVVADPAMSRVYALIERLAKTDLTVLVYGETGTGKELATSALHAWSARSAEPFVSLNCAAITESIVERELFGHEKGAFSGAVSTQKGLLEAADKGTVFLDEIGELSLSIQAKLLRALESKRLTRLGDVKEREIDIRIVAATNRDLEAAVEAGTFRRDLYFRLCGATLWLPPLRDRRRELPLLAHRFLSEACSRAGRPDLVLSSAALHVLSRYDWPGNVRELKNVMEYLAATTSEEAVTADHVTSRLQQAGRTRATTQERVAEAAPVAPLVTEPAPPSQEPRVFRPLDEEIRELERNRIDEALAACGGNQTRAAEAISMPLRTFVTKMRQYNLSPRSGRR